MEATTTPRKVYEDLFNYERQLGDYNSYVKALNEVSKILAAEEIILTKALMDEYHVRGLPVLIGVCREVFDKAVARRSRFEKNQMVFNELSVHQKFFNLHNALNFLRTRGNIDTRLLDCKNGEAFFPLKSQNLIKERNSVFIENENQETVYKCFEDINNSLKTIMEISEKSGENGANFLWNDHGGFLNINNETGLVDIFNCFAIKDIK